jgi:hypothetical protein
MFQMNRGDIRFREIKPNFLSLIVLKQPFSYHLYYFHGIFLKWIYVFTYTHISDQVPIFLFFLIKEEENETDSMTKVWFDKQTFPLVGVPPQITFKT